jgi:hypothetical protein
LIVFAEIAPRLTSPATERRTSLGVMAAGFMAPTKGFTPWTR